MLSRLVSVTLLILGGRIFIDIQEVTAGRARFPKPVMVYKLLSFFGDNIVASEGEEWKRYRKIAAPAFNDKNGKLIWNETIRIVGDLFENVCCKYNSSCKSDFMSLQIALFVLGAAAFGRRMSWKDDEGIPPNHKMTFKSAILEVSTNCFIKLIVPEWAMGITAFTRKVRLASEELDRYMLEMIWSRRNAEKKEEKDDPLSNLLEASSDDSSFTDRDLTGNIFIFLIAGHETTAHTFCFAFALLALYLDQQETLFQHINSVLPEGGLPVSCELRGTSWVLYETLRMFPPVTAIPKYSAEDTTLTISSATGGKRILPVPRGSYVSLNVVGLHYSPRYWKDPDEFRPARFLESDWPRDAFISFSAGPQDCIGRKFFETEGIAVFTMIVSKYEIRIKEEPQFARETFEERKARVLALRPGITMTPLRVPLAFKRR
ncbi:hypothetical protein GYMLUDRAFT_170120 [Collybiopsis luxurians FD-317 M1]|uniref:Cytochrome P450 n=1 Tax=Collybiopsis luxurians FD-317 M1 TaxID=944289 RepID=A0A0D0CTQ6_9AGAR|nr:hypothetical protein GYMLUDRAFT_170120 [Collybiopsis luxurians FD-317 M1]